MLDEGIITTTILKKSTEELMSYAQSSDVIVVGPAPPGSRPPIT